MAESPVIGARDAMQAVTHPPAVPFACHIFKAWLQKNGSRRTLDLWLNSQSQSYIGA